MMGKGKLIFIFVIAMVVISSISSLAAEDVIKVSIDGQYVEYSDTTGYPFIDENNYIQVPLGATLEAFETIISYQNEATAVSRKINTGETINSNVSPIIKNNKVYVPLTMLMEIFKCDVSWNNEEKTVVINSEIPINEEQDRKPEVKIEAPNETKEDEATIKIITDKENSIFLNGSKIEVEQNNKYVVKLSEGDNIFKVEIINRYGAKTEESFMIERIKNKIYLDISARSIVRRNKAYISGKTNLKNEVRINNKKIKIDGYGEFYYAVTDLEIGENTIVVSAKNKESDEEIEKKVEIEYRPKRNEEDKEDKEDEFYEKQVREHNDVSNPDGDSDADPPVIKLDNEIPKTIDKDSFTISGTCTNASYIVINTPLKQSGKIKLKDDGSFSLKAALYTGENGGGQSEKGVYNHIQIFAANKDKVICYEYIVYYKESDSSEE